MRFLLEDIAPLRAHLLAAPCDIKRHEWELNPVERGPMSLLAFSPKRRPAAPPTPAMVTDIEAVFERTGRADQVGKVLRHYFHVNAPASERPVSLAAAIEHVEAYGGPDEFLLAGFPDGGLISVSRRQLPFQNGCRDVTSWSVDTRWAP